MKKYIQPAYEPLDIDVLDVFMVVSGEQTETLTYGEGEGSHEADVKEKNNFNMWDNEW